MDTTADTSGAVERDSLAAAKWTAVSRAAGFFRTALTAAVLGATWLGNIFQLANQLPWMLYELLLGSLMASLLMPSLVTAREKGRDELDRLASTFMGLSVVIFVGLSVAAAAFSPVLASLITTEVDAAERAQARDAALLMLLLVAPQLLGYAVVATARAVQNSRGSFGFPAGAPVIENLILMGFLILYWVVFPADRSEIASIDTTRLLVLGAGNTFAVFVHVALQLYGVRRVGVRLRFRLDWRHPEVRRVARLLRESAAVALVGGARLLALLLVAATVEGGVVVLQISQAFVDLPVSLTARPISSALLRRLSELASVPGREAEWSREYRQASLLNYSLLLPATLLLLAFSPGLARALSFGALSGDHSTELLVAAFAGFAMNIIGSGALILGVEAAYSRRNATAPLRANLARLVGDALFVLLALQVDGAARIFTLLLGVSVTDIVVAGLLHRMITGPGGDGRFVEVARMVTRSVVTIVPLALVAGQIPTGWLEPPGGLVVVGLFGLAAAATYGAWAIRAEPLAGYRRDGWRLAQ